MDERDYIRKFTGDGAVLMDENDPGWYAGISKSRLNMASLKNCIGGQRRGSFQEAMRVFGITDSVILGFRLIPEQMGVFESWDEAWDFLDECWIREINRRLMADQIVALAIILCLGSWMRHVSLKKEPLALLTCEC